MENLNIEIKWEYREKIDLLKSVIPNKDWETITDDWTMLELLVDEFLNFIKTQVDSEKEDWCCGWNWGCGNHDEKKEHWKWWCGCNH